MKHILFITIAISLLASCANVDRQTVKLSGSFEGISQETVTLTLNDLLGIGGREHVDIVLDENAAFVYSLELPGARTADIQLDGIKIPLFLEPGESLHLELTGPDVVKNIRFSGSIGEENNFLLNYQMNHVRTFDFNRVFLLVKEGSPESFHAFIDSIFDLRERAYLQALSVASFSDGFSNFIQAEIRYEKLNWLWFFNSNLRQREAYNEIDSSFMEEPGIIDDAYLLSGNYRQFLNTYEAYHYLIVSPEKYEGMSREDASWLIADEVFPEGTKGPFKAMLLANMIMRVSDPQRISEHLEELRAANPHAAYVQTLESMYQDMLKLLPGKPAPEFTLTDLSGNQVSLSDFFGSVVFLDFWASWCGPCIQQLPYAKELKKRLLHYVESADLVFLYVSVDTDEDAWKNAVASHQIEGVHVWAKGWEGVAKLYNVSGIPTYYIIGRDGMIYDNKPPRPSFAEIDEVLLSALNK
jgi:thiol-disulfide isomerase/thioredoxin